MHRTPCAPGPGYQLLQDSNQLSASALLLAIRSPYNWRLCLTIQLPHRAAGTVHPHAVLPEPTNTDYVFTAQQTHVHSPLVARHCPPSPPSSHVPYNDHVVQALSASESPWHVEGLPLHLLESLRHKLDGTPVELPPIDLPQAVPGLPEGLEQQGPVDKAEAALRLQDRSGT